jgi:hypothetical protein
MNTTTFACHLHKFYSVWHLDSITSYKRNVHYGSCGHPRAQLAFRAGHGSIVSHCCKLGNAEPIGTSRMPVAMETGMGMSLVSQVFHHLPAAQVIMVQYCLILLLACPSPMIVVVYGLRTIPCGRVAVISLCQ